MTLPTIFDLCQPRDDVAKGTIADSDYAANLANVLTGHASRDYTEPSATPSNGKNRAAIVPALPAHAFLSRRTLRLRGGHRQLGKLIVADFGLGYQDTAAKMLDQIGADRAEPPAGQRPRGTMTYNDEICSDLFGDLGDLLSGGSHAQPRRR